MTLKKNYHYSHIFNLGSLVMLFVVLCLFYHFYYRSIFRIKTQISEISRKINTIDIFEELIILKENVAYTCSLEYSFISLYLFPRVQLYQLIPVPQRIALLVYTCSLEYSIINLYKCICSLEYSFISLYLFPRVQHYQLIPVPQSIALLAYTCSLEYSFISLWKT